MKKIIIAAVAKNGVIGKDGKLPWKIPEEMKFFREMTIGNVVVMGRSTFSDLGNKPLPSRLNIILSKEFGVSSFAKDDDDNVHGVSDDFTNGLHLAKCAGEIYLREKNAKCFIIGGASVYAQAIPICDEMYLSRIRKEYEGDTRFPDFDESQFTKEIIKECEEFYVERYTRI